MTLIQFKSKSVEYEIGNMAHRINLLREELLSGV